MDAGAAGRPDGFIGTIGWDGDGSKRYIHVTHSVINGEAIVLEENNNVFRQWICEKTQKSVFEEAIEKIYVKNLYYFGGNCESHQVHVYIDCNTGVMKKPNSDEIHIRYDDVNIEHIYVEEATVKSSEIMESITDIYLRDKIEALDSGDTKIITIDGKTLEFNTLKNVCPLCVEILRYFREKYSYDGNFYKAKIYIDRRLKGLYYFDMPRGVNPDLLMANNIYNENHNEEVVINNTKIIGFIGSVGSNGKIVLAKYLSKSENNDTAIPDYDVADENLQRYFDGNSVPTELWYRNRELNVGDEVYICNINSLQMNREGRNGIVKYELKPETSIYVSKKLSEHVREGNPWLWNRKTGTVFKIETNEDGMKKLCAYTHKRVGSGLNAKRYVDTEAPIKKQFDKDDTFELYQLFRECYPDSANLYETEGEERELLKECIEYFLPEGSDVEGLFEEIMRKARIRKILGISNDISNDNVTASKESNVAYITNVCKQNYADILSNNGYSDDDINGINENICELINQFRDKNAYTHNVVTNMLICMTQGFLTVFSGKPGCGKTSICELLGQCLGLTNYSSVNSGIKSNISYKEFFDFENERVDTSRFIEVSTERGWTSKRDFIGYYNPLTEQFDKTNGLLYNAFLVLDSERGENRKDWPPCFILMDEANLSPMEYYWADFMNLCEEWKESNSIDLGGGRIFHIPETLHFMATINNDHTTEILSPRLIDRANVIDLPDVAYKPLDRKQTPIEIKAVSWKQLKKLFGCKENEAIISGECSDIYKDVKAVIEKHFKISLSARTDIAVSRYWMTASRIFEKEEYVVKKDLINGFIQNYTKLTEQEILECLPASMCQIGEMEKKFNKSEIPQEYEKVIVEKEIQALDYAISQRILPKLTDICGETAFSSLIVLLVKLVEKRLYKAAGIVIDMIQRGYDTGFYNYFR